MAQTYYHKLRGRIIEKHHSLSDFAEKIKYSVGTVSLKLSGGSPFTKRDMVIWMEALDIPVDRLIYYFFPEYLNEA